MRDFSKRRGTSESSSNCWADGCKYSTEQSHRELECSPPMVQNPLFGGYMAASESGNRMPGQKEFVEYWENGGTYEEIRGGSKQTESYIR